MPPHFPKVIPMSLITYFENFLQWIFQKAQKYPVRTLILWVLILLGSIYATLNIKILLEVDELLDPSFSHYESMLSLRDTFEIKNNLMVFVKPEKNWNNNDICRFKKRYNEWLKQQSSVEKAYSSFDIRVTEIKQGSTEFTSLIHPQCDYSNDFFVSQLVPQKSSAAPEAQQNLSATILKEEFFTWDQNSYWEGILLNKNELGFEWYLIDQKDPITKRRFDTQLASQIMEDFKKLIKNEFADLRVRFIGNAAYQHHMLNGYLKVGYLNIVMSFILGIFFWFYFGTIKSSIVFNLIHLQCTIVLTGIMGYFEMPIDVLSISIFMVLMIASVEDFVYLSTSMQAGHSFSESLKKHLIPGFYTSLTTIIGFASLTLSGLPIISRFGLLTALGALFEWICLFLILPAWIKYFPKLDNWVKPRTFKTHNSKLVPNKIISYFLLLFIPLGIYGATHLTHEDSPFKIFVKNHSFRQDIEQLQKERGWNANGYLIFPSSLSTETQKNILEKIKELPLVKGIDSISLWKDTILEPMSEAAKRGYSDLIEGSQAAERYLNDDLESLAFLFLKEDTLSLVQEFDKQVKAICEPDSRINPLEPQKPLCHLTGSIVAYSEFGSRVANTLISSLSASDILIGVIILLLARRRKSFSNRQIFSLICSSFWGPCAILAVLYLFSIKIYFVGTIFAAVLAGFAGDNQIQYIYAENEEPGVWQSAATRVCVLITLFPLVFLLSPFAPLQFLGVIFFLGSLLMTFGDIYLLTGLMRQAPHKIINK